MENKFKGKKVLVFGLGLNQGGVGVARFFANAGAKVRVTDTKSEQELKPSLKELEEFSGIEYHLGAHSNDDIDWADLIIKNPAVKLGNPFMEYAKQQGKQVEMEMGIFLEFVKPFQIIGVTGTKGKSTTSSLINQALQNQSKNVVFGGNIGTSVLDAITEIDQDTLVVLEISSFQLEAFKQHQVSPKYAVITNIFEDHLNYYKNMKDYVEAKRVIAKYQTADDFLFINGTDLVLTGPEFLWDLKGKIIKFSLEDLPKDFKFTLPGEHNKLNYAAALAVAKTLEIDEQEALETMNQFKGVPFRTELIYNQGGIKVYNDTTATNPGAAIASLKAFPSCILIVGGQNANMDYNLLADTIDKYAKAVYFLEGDATEELKKLIRHRNIARSTYSDLIKLLQDIKLDSKEGDTILFSPGAKSFNLFDNEFDRGRKFNLAVQKIFG